MKDIKIEGSDYDHSYKPLYLNESDGRCRLDLKTETIYFDKEEIKSFISGLQDILEVVKIANKYSEDS